MKKLDCLLIPLFIIILTEALANAQTPNFLWAKSAGGRGFDAGWAIATQEFERFSFVTGSFADTVLFDSIPLTTNRDGDVFVAKYDGDGNVLWAKKAGGSGSDRGAAIVLDHYQGFVLVTGTFSNQADFDGQLLNSRGGNDVFVARYDTGGVLNRAISMGGAGNDEVWSIAVDRENNFFVAGSFRGSAIFGSDTLTAVGFVPLIIESAVFNTGTIPVNLKAGGVNVIYAPVYGNVDRNQSVQAFDASRILKYLVGLIHLDPLQRLVKSDLDNSFPLDL